MWFNKNKAECRIEENFRQKEAYLATRELEVYKKEKMAEVDTLVAAYRASCLKETELITLQSAKQKGEYEHEFHNGIEVKKTELAKLDAVLEGKKDLVKRLEDYRTVWADMQKFKAEAAAKDSIIEVLKAELERGDDNFKVVVAKLSKMEINSLGLTVTAKDK